MAGTHGNKETARQKTGPFAFVGAESCESVLDRAEHLRSDETALAALWADARVVMLDADGRTLVDASQAPVALRGADCGAADDAVFLGLDREGRGWFALDAAPGAYGGVPRIDLRSAAALWPSGDAAAFALARAMQHWRQRTRFCSACGHALVSTRAGWLAQCPGCGQDHYPRTDAAVIAAVGDGKRLLLGRQAGWPARRWSVLAGFVEPGESLEQTVAREVLEETGVHVRECRYLASQPWPFPGALMVGFIAHADADEPQVTGELEAARWFDIDEIRAAQAREAWVDTAQDDGGPLLSAPISIARWLIEQWLRQSGTRGGASSGAR